jgi:hypothetical protein
MESRLKPGLHTGPPYSIELASFVHSRQLQQSFDIRAWTFYFAVKDGRRRIDNSNCGVRHSRALSLVVSQAHGFHLLMRLPLAGGSN